MGEPVDGAAEGGPEPLSIGEVLAVLAEEAGFDMIMVSEHFHPWVDDRSAAGFAFSTIGAMAAATSNLEFATGVTTPLWRFHPGVVAQAAATLDRLSGGRFNLGVGTGENVGGRHVGYGDGVYRSLDGGATWENLGLNESEHIGMIVIDPRDSNVVYVAAEGPLWSGGGERGLYRSTDGGERWERILAVGEYTGVNEVHLDPRDPDVIFAVKHQRLRNVAALMNGGPESGIFKSTDGGDTFSDATNGITDTDGLFITPLAMDQANPEVLWTGGRRPWRTLPP